MKPNKIIFSLLLSLLVSSAFASTNSPVITHASLELRDGSKVVGVFTDKTLPLTSASLGDLKLPVERIRSVEWPTDKPLAALSATNGDKFSVELRLTDLPLTSSFGDIKVPVAKIRSLRFWTDNGESPRLPGLVALWSGEGDARDAVSGQTATVVGGVSYVPGKVGQCFHFNGNGSLSFGNTIGNFGINDFTIEFWIRTTSTDSSDAVMEKWTGCGDPAKFEIRMGWSGLPVGHIAAELGPDSGGSSNTHYWMVSSKAINDGVFHHVALVRQTTNLIFYIDGTFDTNNTQTGIANINNSANFVAGNSVCVNWDSTQMFRGDMDEISVYNRALSADEVRQLCGSGN